MQRRSDRRDILGRRIGYNWWREYVMAAYSPARTVWENEFEVACNMTYTYGIISRERRLEKRGGRREVMDFVRDNPPPTLKDFLLDCAGINAEPDEQAA